MSLCPAPQRTDWAEKENVLPGGSKEVGVRKTETAERKTDTHHKPLKPLQKSGPVAASKLQICLYVILYFIRFHSSISIDYIPTHKCLCVNAYNDPCVYLASSVGKEE